MDNCYTASFQISNVVTEDNEIFQKLEKTLSDPLTFKNIIAVNKDDPAYIEGKFIPGTLSLHFSLDAPISLAVSNNLLSIWKKAITELPPENIVHVKPNLLDQIQAEVNQLIATVADQKKLEVVQQDLKNVIRKLQTFSTSTQNENESTPLTDSLQQCHRLLQEHRKQWMLPNLESLQTLLSETGEIIDEAYQMKEDIGQKMSKCNFEQPALELSKDWNHLLLAQFASPLESLIENVAEAAATIWTGVVKDSFTHKSLFKEVEKNLLHTSIATLRKFPVSSYIYKDDETHRWIAIQHPESKELTPLDYNIHVPFPNVIFLRQSKCKEDLNQFKTEAQLQFLTTFNKCQTWTK